MTSSDRALLALAGLMGLLGVAASAAAAHTSGGDTLRTAAQFLLFHAPVVIGLVALGAFGVTHRFVTRLASVAILIGLALFSGDLALRTFFGAPLFPMAAPSGGIVLMLGWALVIAVALMPVRGRAGSARHHRRVILQREGERPQ